MNIESLQIFSQNVRKNKTLTETILETEKNSTDIILIQEPPQYITKYVPSPHNADGDPVQGHLSHPEWTTYARPPNNQDDIPRVITYINKRLQNLQPMLRRDIIDHRDINLTSLTINHSCAFILNIYSNESHTAISFLRNHELNIDNTIIMTGDFNVWDSDCVMNHLSCTKFFSIFLFF